MLEQEFRGRLRIRWSLKAKEFHIEEKVGRAALPPFRIDPNDDSMIRARDGYSFVMSVRAGDRMPCPKCGTDLKVPIMHTAEVRCGYCRMKGVDGRVKAAFYPLSETLIDYLKKIDPERGAAILQAQESDRHNAALLASRERASMNDIEASTKDNWNQIAGIPSFGYTGKVLT